MCLFINLKNGATPLFVAAGKGYEEIVQILMEKGEVNVNSQKMVFFSSSKVTCLLQSLSFFPFFLKTKIEIKKRERELLQFEKKLKPIQQKYFFC